MDDKLPKVKILILGDSAVGKTSLLKRYTDDIFTSETMATIGVDYKSKIINVNGSTVNLQIWDTAGAEKFRSITKAYYHGAHGVIILFDLNQRFTFINVCYWIKSIGSIPCVLVGNKRDLECDVMYDEVKEIANNYNIKYFEVSAKENVNINESFEYITANAYNYYLNNNKVGQEVINIIQNDQPEKKCKCNIF